MPDKSKVKKKLKKSLKKEVHLPIREPKSKIGKQLTKSRNASDHVPFATYVKESWRELRKVTWPSRKESIVLTLAVIVFTAMFALFTVIADFGINEVVERILL